MNCKLILLSLLLSMSTLAITAQTKIACVGNSITYGYGVANREMNSYPSQLQCYLGSNYIVENFGVSGATATSTSSIPYIKTSNYKKSLDFAPDIVFIKLGANDSKSVNMLNYGNFKSDYGTLIDSYKSLATKPRIILVTPLKCYLTDEKNIYDPRIQAKITPAIEQLAYEKGVEVFDGYSLFGKDHQFELMPDKLHPSSIGAGILAMNFDRYITSKRDWSFNIFNNLKGGTDFNFYGFKGKEFDQEGVKFKVVQPKIANKKHSWVIRARFWGHEPQLDKKLLELGFHIVYCDVENLYGSPIAVDRWTKFYKTMTSNGLNSKVVLEGMSRGGLIVYNWAVDNLKRVSAIYADAPVLDLKSWPMGEGEYAGSESDTEHMLKSYNMTSRDEMLAYKSNPIDHAKKIAKSKISIIHVVGAADNIVPVKENTDIFADRLRKAGSDMTIISKPNVGHHPHSLATPEPIVRSILKAEGLYENHCIKPIRGNEYRSGAGWIGGSDWNNVSDDITTTLKNKSVDILMLGNSITQGASKDRKLVTHKFPHILAESFKELTWESAGISGDRTQHLLWRIQNGGYNLATPKYVTIAIGVNNLLSGNDDVTSTYDGIIAVTDAALKEFPESKIILFGLLPTSANNKLTDYYKIQSKLKDTKFNRRVTYIDPTPYFTDSDGQPKKDLYSGDMIHLKADGYRVWANIIYDTVHKLK